MRYLVLLILVASISCTKKNSVNTVEAGIVGKWKQTERYSDIGNGTGSWEGVSSTENITINFSADGSLEANGYRDLSAYNRYELIAPNQIRVYSNTNTSKDIQYMLDGQLTVTYPCRERCQDRFVRTN